MAEVGAYLTDHVLPHLPLRQWVLSLPKRLRPYLHHDAEVAGAVLRIFLRALRTTLRSASPGAPRAVLGFLVERRVGPARVFLNAENLLDARQTRWDPVVRPARSRLGRWTTNAGAPLEGRVLNGGVRWTF